MLQRSNNQTPYSHKSSQEQQDHVHSNTGILLAARVRNHCSDHRLRRTFVLPTSVTQPIFVASFSTGLVAFMEPAIKNMSASRICTIQSAIFIVHLSLQGNAAKLSPLALAASYKDVYSSLCTIISYMEAIIQQEVTLVNNLGWRVDHKLTG